MGTSNRAGDRVTDHGPGTARQPWAPHSGFHTFFQPLKQHILPVLHPPQPKNLPSRKQDRVDEGPRVPWAASPSLPPSLAATTGGGGGPGAGRRAAGRAARPSLAGFPVRAAPDHPFLPTTSRSAPGLCVKCRPSPPPSRSHRHGARRADRASARLRGGGGGGGGGGKDGRGEGRPRGAVPRACAEETERRGHPSPRLHAPAPAAPERGWACGVTATAPSRAPAQAARGSGEER